MSRPGTAPQEEPEYPSDIQYDKMHEFCILVFEIFCMDNAT